MEKGQRLSKVLAAAGVASRRASEELIFAGKVQVNGKVVFIPQTLVTLPGDRITCSGKAVHNIEPKIYYMLNKPLGYICSNKRVGTKKLVIDLFRALPYRLFTVGRLDRDTSGLLLVTNDGHFADQVIHPSAGLSKEYLVKVREDVAHEHLLSISEGAFIEQRWIKPAKVVKVRRGTLKVTVMEGKKREVRYLAEKAGLHLLSLERIRIGGLKLGPLPHGSWRELSEKERQTIFL